MTLVLDSGAFIAVERRDRDTVALIKSELAAGRVPITHAGVVGQVWRGGGGRQALLATLLRATEISPLDDPLARRAGTLLRWTGTSDVIDAALMLLASDGDTVLTSDPEDMTTLALASGHHVDLVAV